MDRIERALLSILWHSARVRDADAERKLVRMYRVSESNRLYLSYVYMVYRYRVELDYHSISSTGSKICVAFVLRYTAYLLSYRIVF